MCHHRFSRARLAVRQGCPPEADMPCDAVPSVADMPCDTVPGEADMPCDAVRGEGHAAEEHVNAVHDGTIASPDSANAVCEVKQLICRQCSHADGALIYLTLAAEYSQGSYSQTGIPAACVLENE